jgi:hypothetical protein
MLSIRSFLRRNALYTLYAFLFIAIPVQIGTPQNVRLPVPLPFVGVRACTGFQNAYLQVNPGVVNASYITADHIGWEFTGTARGSTEEEIIDSTVAVLRNGEIVQEYRAYKIIYVEVVEGADTSSSGVTGQVGGVGGSVGGQTQTGEKISVPKLTSVSAGLMDFFSPRSHSYAQVSATLSSVSNSTQANYYSFWIVGVQACNKAP